MSVFIQKQYPENFTFLILRIVELLNSLKSGLILTSCIVSECLKTNFSHISRARISKSKRCFNVKSSTYYFHMKDKDIGRF